MLMVGASIIADAARKELGEEVIKRTPIRVSCPSCGLHLVSVMTTPNLLRDRCEKCHTDIVALVTKDGDIFVAQDRVK